MASGRDAAGIYERLRLRKLRKLRCESSPVCAGGAILRKELKQARQSKSKSKGKKDYLR